MARFVLLSDTTLLREYHKFPLLDFLPCSPTTLVPKFVYNYLKSKPPQSSPDGRAVLSPYAVRKIEAALLQRFTKEQVVVPAEDRIESFIDADTEIISIYTMDPLGLGPLTMSYAVLFGSLSPYVKYEFEMLMQRVNKARTGKKAKVIVGGPGVWEFSLRPDEAERLGIDYLFMGEADDVVCDLFEDIATGSMSTDTFFKGFYTYDDYFAKTYVKHSKFITRSQYSKRLYPKLEDIPLIQGPTIKSLTEVMRGCGVGCDFCEVTLRPSRYYSYESIEHEIKINQQAGHTHAWLHSDEIFIYQSKGRLEPNQEAIIELFKRVMSIPGIKTCSPTHGRISIPAGYPEMMEELSKFSKAGPDNWVGMQVGIETGSEELAKKHMPAKTLPLRIGVDGSWHEIILNGTKTLTKNYWRPAFTVQVGQTDETDEDNWETVRLVNTLSNSYSDGRPLEFTITPMQNVPLGRIRSKDFNPGEIDLTASQLAVYYACYRHLVKIATRSTGSTYKRGLANKLAFSTILPMGSKFLMGNIEKICRKKGLDIEKVKKYGLPMKIGH